VVRAEGVATAIDVQTLGEWMKMMIDVVEAGNK
jgi:hypothetical protein